MPDTQTSLVTGVEPMLMYSRGIFMFYQVTNDVHLIYSKARQQLSCQRASPFRLTPMLFGNIQITL